jgi:hypothetical protein
MAAISSSNKSSRQSEWATPRSYIVPRNPSCNLPPGTTLIGSLRSYAIGPYISSAVIRAVDWGAALVIDIRELVVIPVLQDCAHID